MSDLVTRYTGSVFSLFALASIVVVQVAVATAATRHAGQVPGMSLTVGPASFAFRAHRAHQNSLENAVLFVTALLAALLAGAEPVIVDAAALVFVGTRLAHAVSYYLGVEAPRTAAFAFGLLAVLTLVVTTGAAL